MAQSDRPCWCNKAQVPQELIDLVPSELKRKSCICGQCIASFRQDSDKFKAQLLKANP